MTNSEPLAWISPGFLSRQMARSRDARDLAPPAPAVQIAKEASNAKSSAKLVPWPMYGARWGAFSS